MPPKAKKGGQNKKKQTKISIDDVDTTTLSKEKLEEFCVDVSNELNKEKQNSEFLRLDRDKLVSMIAISREHLEMLRCNKRQIESDIRDAEDEHRVVMNFKRQKVIHFKNELESNCLNQKVITKNVINDNNDSHKEIVNEITRDIIELRRQIIQAEDDWHKNKLEITSDHAENIYEIRDKENRMHVLTETKRERIVKEITAQLQTMFISDYNALVQLKNKDHRRSLDENVKRTMQLKYYYNRIICHNQELMQHMKYKMGEIKASSGQLDMKCLQLKKENLKKTEELSRLNKEKINLQKQLFNSEQHKYKLNETKNKLQKNKRFLLDLKIESDVLDMIKKKQYINQEEEDIRLSTALIKSCSKAQSVILVIEIFVIHLQNSLNKINAHLTEIKRILERKGKWNKLLGSVKEYHNISLDSINYEIAETAEKRDDLFRTYREMLKKFNIPFENTGFTPLRFEEMLSKINNTSLLVNDSYILNNPMIINTFFRCDFETSSVIE